MSVFGTLQDCATHHTTQSKIVRTQNNGPWRAVRRLWHASKNISGLASRGLDLYF